jgi:hypothetical protein
MSEHPREHEDLLAALLAGERGPAEPEVAQRLRECATCREQWTRLRTTAAQLERAGTERRTALAELERVGPAPGEERLLATLERLAAGEPRARGRRSLAWLAAAAVLVALAWIARGFLGGGDGRDPAWLGEGALQIVAPEGEGSFERFSWTYTGSDADSFTLRIFELKDGARGKRLLIRERLKETTWVPEAEEQEKLPARIFWEVEALDVFRVVLPGASDSAQAWRSSR